jgi:glycolate oxidase
VSHKEARDPARTPRPSVERRLPRRLERSLSRASGGSASTALEDRICYSFDATDLRGLPDVVVWPRSTEQVAEVIRLAHVEGIPVVPRGAGTGYTGGSVPIDGGIALSLEKMNRIVSIDVRRQVAVVEPGVVNNDLRSEAETLGLFYPPDPASLLVSTIGGNVAECAGGPRTVLYGTTRDYVVGLELVLADGTIVATGLLAEGEGGSGPDAHEVSGWDPGQLFVGSEGTLAVVTKIVLRLSELPEAVATYWAEFPSLSDAARGVAAITATGLPVSVLEILDRETLSSALEYFHGSRPEHVSEGALLIEVEGAREAVEGGAEKLVAVLDECGATNVRRATTHEERDDIWEVRRSISPSLARIASGKINEDIAVPRSSIPDFVERMREVASDLDLAIHAFVHAGDGNLHVNIMVDRSDRAALSRAREAVGRLFEIAIRMGGTLSGEHGIGITKAEHLRLELDDRAIEATERVKRALDRRGILNPDKILSDRANPWWETLEGGDAPEEGTPCS